MASAEALIRRRLVEDAALSAALARYAGQPAVFYAAPPDDTDANWQGGRQYPRATFFVDWRNEPAYDVGGSVSLDIVSAETETPPEPLALAARKALSGVFFAPAGDHVFTLSWESAQPYQMKAEVHREPLINGLALSFRLTAFPERETIDPDPVMALNRYAKAWDAGVMLVRDIRGVDIHEPTDRRPVAYFRPLDKTNGMATNTVAWVNATIAMHLYAPSMQARAVWLEAFAQRLQLDGEATMPDGSPLFIEGAKLAAAADESSGQLTLATRYGLLRRPRYAHPLLHIRWNEGGRPSAAEDRDTATIIPRTKE